MADINTDYTDFNSKTYSAENATNTQASANKQTEENYFTSSLDDKNAKNKDSAKHMEEANEYLNLVDDDTENKQPKSNLSIDTNNPSLICEYDDNGFITSVRDESTNRTTYYSYDSATGNVVSSKTYVGDNQDELMNECTYNEKGLVEDKKEYISEETGMRGEYLHSYKYDDQNRLTSSTVRTGHYKNGEIVGDYIFEYDGNSTVPKTREDKVHGEILEYQYEGDKRVGYVCKNTSGEIVCKCKYNDDGTIKSREEDDQITFYEYQDGIVIKSDKYDKNDVDSNGNPKGSPKQTDYYQNGQLHLKVRGDYAYVYEYGDNGEIKTVKYNYGDWDFEKDEPKPGKSPVSTNNMSSITYDKLSNNMNMELGQELANLASANEMGTSMRCLSGVIRTLNAKWPEDSWEANGCRPGVAADSFANMDNPNDPIAKHFAEVEVPVSDLKSLPAGCIVVWDYNFPGSQGMGHITVTMGNGAELSDHYVDDMYIDYNTAYKVYYPVD